MKKPLTATVVVTATAMAAVLGVVLLSGTAGATTGGARHPVIRITVMNLNTSSEIREHGTVPAGTPFQATVTTNGVDCAGQVVVTAAGTAGAPPSVPVQFIPFIIGSAVNTDSVTSSPLVAGVVPGRGNDFKISATCNGAAISQFGVSTFEFFVE